jgi:hypothetical protein
MNDLESAEAHLGELDAYVDEYVVSAKNPPWSIRYFNIDFRGELLRLRGDPLALSVLEEGVALVRANTHLYNRYILIYAERHLQFAMDPANRWTRFPLLP